MLPRCSTLVMDVKQTYLSLQIVQVAAVHQPAQVERLNMWNAALLSRNKDLLGLLTSIWIDAVLLGLAAASARTRTTALGLTSPASVASVHKSAGTNCREGHHV